MWSYQAIVKLYIFEWLTNKVLCSMYSDGLSSVTGKAYTWTEREHQYEKNLRESTTMKGDTKLVYNVIKFWFVLMHWHAWTLNESGNLDNWGQRIIMLWLKYYFMIFDADGVICAGDGRWLPIDPHEMTGMRNYMSKSRNGWHDELWIEWLKLYVIICTYHECRLQVSHSQGLYWGVRNRDLTLFLRNHLDLSRVGEMR